MEKEFINLTIGKQNEIKIEDEDDAEEIICGGEKIPELKKTKVTDKKICYKCKINSSKYFNRSEFICECCFLRMVNHKFRSNLRAHCKIRHEDNLLVCISGGNCSIAMLHWFYTTFNDNTSNRKQFFKLKVLYVDDLFIINSNIEEERLYRRKVITDLCNKYNFPFAIINLEHVMDLSNNPDNTKIEQTNHDLIKIYMDLFQIIPNIGSFDHDFNFILKRNLIFYYALTNGFNKVVLGSNSDSLVSNIFSNIIKGRGFTIKEDVDYIDNHFLNGKIQILRPMKDFLTKEILLFNYINKVDLLFNPNFIEKNIKHNIPFKGDTRVLVNHFFDNLQNKMTATISTVLGTTDKIKTKQDEGKTCSFCLNYRDEIYNPLEIGSIDVINSEKIFLKENLCFACKRMFQHCEVELPIFIL